MELGLLKLLTDKELLDKLSGQIKKKTLSKEANVILSDYLDYFASFPTHTQVDMDKFSEWFCLVKHAAWEADQLDIYKKIFTAIAETEVDQAFEDSILGALHTRWYAAQMSDIANRISLGQGDPDLEGIEILLDEYYKKYPKKDATKDKLVTDDTEELLEHYNATKGYNWRLKELNLSLGELRKGDFVLFGARPDAGKTSLMASEASYIASQLPAGKYIIWFNNEEQGYKVRTRIIQAALSITFKDIQADPVKVREDYYNAVGGRNRIIIYDSADITSKDVERLLDKYDPGLIIFDQLSKINIGGNPGNDVERLLDLARYARGLAKTHAPVLSTIWADTSAEGQKYIEQNQLYASKTGMQGECDAIVTIGRVHDPSIANNTRFIYVPKNKLFGKDESLRNGKFEVTLHAEKARYEGMR